MSYETNYFVCFFNVKRFMQDDPWLGKRIRWMTAKSSVGSIIKHWIIKTSHDVHFLMIQCFACKSLFIVNGSIVFRCKYVSQYKYIIRGMCTINCKLWHSVRPIAVKYTPIEWHTPAEGDGDSAQSQITEPVFVAVRQFT